MGAAIQQYVPRKVVQRDISFYDRKIGYRFTANDAFNFISALAQLMMKERNKEENNKEGV